MCWHAPEGCAQSCLEQRRGHQGARGEPLPLLYRVPPPPTLATLCTITARVIILTEHDERTVNNAKSGQQQCSAPARAAWLQCAPGLHVSAWWPQGALALGLQHTALLHCAAHGSLARPPALPSASHVGEGKGDPVGELLARVQHDRREARSVDRVGEGLRLQAEACANRGGSKGQGALSVAPAVGHPVCALCGMAWVSEGRAGRQGCCGQSPAPACCG